MKERNGRLTCRIISTTGQFCCRWDFVNYLFTITTDKKFVRCRNFYTSRFAFLIHAMSTLWKDFNCFLVFRKITRAVLAIYLSSLCLFFFRTLQPPNPPNWQPGQGDEATGSGSNSQSSSRPPSNSGVDGPTTPEGEEMTKAFIKSDISITSLLNCFRIRCVFNNVFNNISLKGEFIGGYCFIAPLLC